MYRRSAPLAGLLVPFFLINCVGDEPAAKPVGQGDAGGARPDAGSGNTDAGAGTSALKAVAIATGTTHSCALTASPGTVVCWGSNANGELGRSGPASAVPVNVALPDQAKAIAAGDRFSCATLVSGKTYCWGINESAQSGRLPLGPAVSTGPIAADVPRNEYVEYTKPWVDSQVLLAGGDHACALSLLGESKLARDVSVPFCWGSNMAGQLGREGGGYSEKALIPLLSLKDGTAANPALGNYTLRGMALGSGFYCAIGLLYSTSGFYEGLYCVGKNDRNQRGFSGPMFPYGYPTTAQAAGASPAKVVFAPQAVAAGSEHACVLGENEAKTRGLYCWGAADKGQIGSVTETATDGLATLVPGLGDARFLWAGGRNTCASKGGAVSCWGDSSAGQLGKIDAAPNPKPIVIEGLPAVSALAIGGEHICVVVGGSAMEPGEVRCWGSNRNGQLGDGVDLVKGYPGDLKEQFLRTKPVAVRDAAP
jgi:alpha-tubulin suppressor-like RCC1 family protein